MTKPSRITFTDLTDTLTGETGDTGNKNNGMENSTLATNPTTVLAKSNVVLEPTESGKSHRLTVYNHEGYDPAHDLYLNEYGAAKAALEAVGKWAAGGLFGNSRLMLVAPTAKFEYENGTGVMAYVSSEYNPRTDAITVKANGNNYIISVDPRDVPKRERNIVTYQKLRILQGVLYGREDEEPITAQSGSTLFWRCYAQGLLLDGQLNLSIGIGPWLLKDAEDIVAVANSENPAEENDARRAKNRRAAAFRRDVLETAPTWDQPVDSAAPTPDSEFDVPLEQGGVIDIRSFKVGQPITICVLAGIPANRPWKVLTGTDGEYLTLARNIKENDYLVRL